MTRISAAFFAAILLLTGCGHRGEPGVAVVTNPVPGSPTPDATFTFAVTGSAITLSCSPACTGSNHDTLKIKVDKNLQFNIPAGDLAVISFEEKNNTDVFPFDSNPSTLVFGKPLTFNTRHSLPGSANELQYRFHLFLYDPTAHAAYYIDPLIIIGR
jgi:hypothetical protein